VRYRARIVTAFLLVALLANRAVAGPPASKLQFVPNHRWFWDDSKNWTTNFGPAYRDADIELTQLLPCYNQFALCFHSGPTPVSLYAFRGWTFGKLQVVSASLNFTLLTVALSHGPGRRTRIRRPSPKPALERREQIPDYRGPDAACFDDQQLPRQPCMIVKASLNSSSVRTPAGKNNRTHAGSWPP
jgi:hypothetical protein